MKVKKESLLIPIRKGRMLLQIKNKKGFGINEIIGIAAGVIIAAVIVIPGLRTFTQTIMTQMTTWWNKISLVLFA